MSSFIGSVARLHTNHRLPTSFNTHMLHDNILSATGLQPLEGDHTLLRHPHHPRRYRQTLNFHGRIVLALRPRRLSHRHLVRQRNLVGNQLLMGVRCPGRVGDIHTQRNDIICMQHAACSMRPRASDDSYATMSGSERVSRR